MIPASPNCGERRLGARPSIIVIHYTGMASCAAARARLCDPASEVSAHWLISESGAVEALVPEDLRAWHAGAGEWAGVTDVNSASIGIELANPGDAPFAAPQMVALEGVLRGAMARWGIGPHRVIGHSDMAPLRKIDPGLRFDWRALAVQGLAVWPDGACAGVPGDFAGHARRFGYGGWPEEAIHGAFRLRFRPWAEGPVDAVDAGLAAELAARWPVDGVAAGA